MTKFVLPTVSMFLLASFLTCSIAFARDNTYKEFGTVESIGQNEFTINIRNSNQKATFAVDNFSDFEIEFADRSQRDEEVPFSELKVGDSVKVEAYKAQAGQKAIVDDVEIRR